MGQFHSLPSHLLHHHQARLGHGHRPEQEHHERRAAQQKAADLTRIKDQDKKLKIKDRISCEKKTFQ